VSLAATPVTVLNGSGAPGAAARAAADLRRLGVRVVGTGNAAKPTGRASTLAYPPSMAQQAKLFSAVLDGKVKLVKATGGASLVLTVGSGFRLG
jgi:NADPH-dependent glutamate synthase beta subunit-like oxidoreductase